MRIHEPRAFVVGVAVAALVVLSAMVGINDSAREVRRAKAAERKLAPGRRAPQVDARAERLNRFTSSFHLRDGVTQLLVFVPELTRNQDRLWELIRDLATAVTALDTKVVIVFPRQPDPVLLSSHAGRLRADFDVDRSGAAFRSYRALPLGLPKTFVVDREGVIRHVSTRLRAETLPEIVDEVRAVRKRR